GKNDLATLNRKRQQKGTAMIRIPGWILGAVLVLVIAACGAGDKAEETPAATAVQPPAQPATQPPSRPAPQPESESRPEAPPEPEPAPPALPAGRLYTAPVRSFISPGPAGGRARP